MSLSPAAEDNSIRLAENQVTKVDSKFSSTKTLDSLVYVTPVVNQVLGLYLVMQI